MYGKFLSTRQNDVENHDKAYAWGEGCDSFELIGALHTVLLSLRFMSKVREIGMCAKIYQV